jgi:hypothetical protein
VAAKRSSRKRLCIERRHNWPIVEESSTWNENGHTLSTSLSALNASIPAEAVLITRLVADGPSEEHSIAVKEYNSLGFPNSLISELRRIWNHQHSSKSWNSPRSTHQA